ncbi:uncharacterized protein LOC112492334 [Ziziphus jujuba]|uniref:Uncharacterized protein LOC112492334 n=1 Tax=Ziziphus jujuba TaxID=326968 RepID=A0ABM3IRQ3_ZIZJJ|nr:uncharacterized protein LOC112492334 [Ziziphus jujuba]
MYYFPANFVKIAVTFLLLMADFPASYAFSLYASDDVIGSTRREGCQGCERLMEEIMKDHHIQPFRNLRSREGRRSPPPPPIKSRQKATKAPPQRLATPPPPQLIV